MKVVKPFIFLAIGFMVILFAGCFPAVGIQDGQGTDGPAMPDAEPFTMTVYIGPQSGQGRAISGPTITDVKSGLYNFIQLIVIDESGAIVAYDESRREKSDEDETILRIDSLPFGMEVHFLLLLGHWERDYAADTVANGVTTFAYKDNVKPVLLAAGYQNKQIEGSETITITMWPLVVDTKFTATGTAMIEGGIGRAAELLPGFDWNVRWNIRRNTAGANGLEYLLAAQRAVYPNSTELSVGGKKFIRDGVEIPIPGSTSVQDLLLNLGQYEVSDIGVSHWANFYMEYIPYNLANAATWREYDDESIFDFAGGAPVWIIRNGLNNVRQDENTTFDSSLLGRMTGSTRYNGNGAVVSTAKEEKGFTDTDPEDNVPDGTEDDDDDGFPDDLGDADEHDLIIYNGKFLGPETSANPAISFKTAGYDGTAKVYYGIVEAGGEYNAGNPLPYSEFTQAFTELYAAGGPHTATVTLPDANTEYDIWLVFLKDGKMSNRIAINTVMDEIPVDWIWGPDGNKGGVLIYNLSESQSIISILVRDSSGSAIPQADIMPENVTSIVPIAPQSVQVIVLDPGTYTCEARYPAGSTQPQPKEVTIEERKFSSWYVSDVPLSIGILQIINLSGESVTSVMTGTQELLPTPVADTGLYSIPMEPGYYPIRVKLESRSDYFAEETVQIAAGDVTNLVVFNDGIITDVPGTGNEGNNLWIVNRCPQPITKAEGKIGSGSYAVFLTEPISSGGYAGTSLNPATYSIRVTLDGNSVVEKTGVVITNDPVYLIVRIGSDDQPEIVVISPSGDTDGDGFPDWWEREYFGPEAVFDPTIPGRDADADGDRLSNWDEYESGTNPIEKDTDGDGLTDWEEVFGARDPSVPDRRPDFRPSFPTTDPLRIDTDGDGYSDYIEICERSDPNDPRSIPGISMVFPWGRD
jgi:hypothetical protein